MSGVEIIFVILLLAGASSFLGLFVSMVFLHSLTWEQTEQKPGALTPYTKENLEWQSKAHQKARELEDTTPAGRFADKCARFMTLFFILAALVGGVEAFYSKATDQPSKLFGNRNIEGEP